MHLYHVPIHTRNFIIHFHYSQIQTTPISVLVLVAQRISMQNLSIVQFSILGSKEYERGRNLARLARSPNPGFGSKALHLLSRTRSRLQRRMDWARGYGIHPNALGHELFRQRYCE